MKRRRPTNYGLYDYISPFILMFLPLFTVMLAFTAMVKYDMHISYFDIVILILLAAAAVYITSKLDEAIIGILRNLNRKE